MNILKSLPSEEKDAIDKLLTTRCSNSPGLVRAAKSAVRELSGGLPMTPIERFVVFLHACDVSGPLDEADALTRGLARLMELVDPGWCNGHNMGDDWASHVSCHPDALLLLDLAVRRSSAAEDMVQAIRAGLRVLRAGGTLSDRQRTRLSSCWRWDERSVWCQAVDALLCEIDRRDKGGEERQLNGL